MHFGFDLECISNPFSISTLVGDSLMARLVYGGCVISMGSRETLVHLKCPFDKGLFALSFPLEVLPFCICNGDGI